MKDKKKIVVILIIFMILALAGCGTSKEEKEKGQSFLKQYKGQITAYIKETYGNKSRITSMRPCYTTKYDSVWFGSDNYANGSILTAVKLSGKKFNVLFVHPNKYYTDRNIDKIEESFKKYVIDAMGTDKIILVKLKYGIDPIYYSLPNYVDNSITEFEQLYDKNNIILIECYLKDANVKQLKEAGTFSYLENIVLNGTNEFGLMGVVFVNINSTTKLSEKDWNKIHYLDYFDFGYITVGDRIYSILTSEYTKKYPNNTYCIRFDKNKKLISLVY